MTRRVGLGGGSGDPPGSAGGAGDPRGARKVRRDWPEIVFLGSILGAVAAFIFASPEIVSKMFTETAGLHPLLPYLWPLGPGAALGYAVVRLVRLLRGEPVADVTAHKVADAGPADDGVDSDRLMSVRRNWFSIAFHLAGLFVFGLAFLIFSGVFVWLVFEGLVAMYIFLFFLLCGLVAAWVMLFQDLRLQLKGQPPRAPDVPQWPHHP